jgi:cytosine/adenosine deaminase-related metal-dependent hydrolase
VGTLVYGKYLILDSETWLDSGAVYVEGGRIKEAGPYTDIKKKYRPDKEIGSDHHLITPGFINAHGHGKGVTDFQRGHIDDTLETWKFRSYPPVDIYYDTMWAAVKQLEAGVTTTMHNHNLTQSQDYIAEFERILDAYRTCRLNIALAPALADKNWFVYGDNEAFMRSLPPHLEDLCRERVRGSNRFGPQQYFNAVQRLRRERTSQNVTIMHGPMSPQWVDEDSLKSIQEDSLLNNTRIHIHVQQTQLQYLYGYKEYGKTLIQYLYELGFFEADVTCGHAVWISREDIAVLAEAGVTVTHHPACNLRVRNGVSPVYHLLEAGVPVGIGMDDKELGDDKDFIEEMRLVSKLHRVPSHELDSPHLLPKDAFRMGTEYGAKTLGFDADVGTIEQGKKADLVLFDINRITEPFVAPFHSPIDLLIYRGSARDVDMVMVEGEIVVKNGKAVHVDREKIAASLRSALHSDYTEAYEKRNRQFVELRPYVAQWFKSWYSEIEERGIEPFYYLNGIL